MDFSAADLSQPRLTWHPSVHTALGEHCAFLLLRVAQDWSTSRDLIRKILKAHSVGAYGIYPLFGYYDVLIKIWANHDLVERVVQDLVEKPECIENVEEFHAREVEYVWWKSSVDPRKVLEYYPHIEQVAQACLNRSLTVDNPDFREIERAGFAQNCDGYPQGYVKVFVMITNIPRKTWLSNRELHNMLKTGEIADISPFEEISLYSGLGFANLIIKAAARSFDEIFPVIKRLSESLKRDHLKTTTLIVSSRECDEADRITRGKHFGNGHISRELITFIGLESQGDFQGLNDKERLELERIFRDRAYLKNTPFQDYFASYLRYRISSSTGHLVALLAFVPRLEFLLRDFLIRAFAETWGRKEWFTHLKMAIENVGHADSFVLEGPTRFTLVQLLRAYGHIKASEPGLQSYVEQILGLEWERAILQFGELRNDFAHGRIYEPKYPHPPKEDFEEMIFSVAQVFNKLEHQNLSPSIQPPL